ncbi:DEKNAAC100880 [Brettanomyces naardenensis]|uniref:DEKNAAC100880 n=1 Tax=Brettanomyces naardenensis TaxID=13370 RepID=A0A448YFN1_BRENA|nr:DEKNAAC100880 [Brettanomyces naardenensis]
MKWFDCRQALKVSRSFTNRRYACPVNVRFIQSKSMQEREILARYQAKLEEKARAEGLKNTTELKEKMKDEIDRKKKLLNKIDPLKELEDYERAEKLRAALEGKKGPKKDLGAIDPSSPEKPFKTLNSYVRVDKVKDLPADQISLIWRARFQMKERSLCAVVPGQSFDRLYKNARKYPTFVLPLLRDDAQVEQSDNSQPPMEMHFVQWAFVGPSTTHVLITSLAEYKLHKEYARPHTTIAFHSELKDSKDIVLMSGQVDKDAAVSLQDAQLLLLNLQRFYGGLGEESEISKERLRLVEQFNTGSANFDMEKFMQLAQSLEN